jgi:hypothetical protein
MRTTLYIGLVSLISISSFAQDVKEKMIEPFTGISTSGVANIRYKNSDSSMLTLKGTSDDFDKVEFYVKENTLFIHTKGNISNPLTIYVSGNKLSEVDASGATTFRTAGMISAPHFQVNSSGASNLNLELTANDIKAVVTGASNLTLLGSTRSFNSVVTGAGNLKAYDLIADTCDINASGASNARIYAAQKINVSASGASNVKFKGNPNSVSAEGSTASKIMKVNADGGTSSTPGDTSRSKTSFKYKNKEIIIVDNDSRRNYNYGASDLTRKHWQGLWLGFGGYTNPALGFKMNSPYKYMELDYGRSFNFQWNLAQRNVNIVKKYVQLSTGIGVQFSNLKFDNNTKLNADSSFTWGYVDSSNTFSYRKNRFKQSYVTVPLLLNFNTSKRLSSNFHISVGVVGKYLLTSRTKQLLVQNNNEFTAVRKDDYNINPFQFDGYASIGYRNFTVFSQYALNQLFRKDRGPQVYLFAIGIRVLSFD